MILGVIQARLTSTRLPNKVLKEVGGRTLLSIMLHRLRNSKYLDKIIVAIPQNDKNIKLRNFLEENRIPFIAGSEDDVLARFYQASQKFSYCHAIVRMTGDCPLIDPEVVDSIIKKYVEVKQFDYVRTGESFADGLGAEVFSKIALEEANRCATLALDREHVTTFFKNNPERFSCYTVINDIDDKELRFTVDTSEDFLLVKKILLYFGSNNLDFKINDIRKYFIKHPEIALINKNTSRSHFSGKL